MLVKIIIACFIATVSLMPALVILKIMDLIENRIERKNRK